MSSKFKYWIIGVQVVFVLLLAAVSTRPIPFEFSRPMAAAMIIWVVGAFNLIITSFLLSLKGPRPMRASVALMRSEWRIPVRAFEWAVLLGLAIALHGWAKSMIPHVTSYWADPVLAEADAFLFGQDPWPLFRSDLLKTVYAKAYVGWFAITFGFMGLLAFSKRDHGLLFNSYLVSLIGGGTVGQYLLPSAGPIFYERIGLGTRFAELVATNDPTYGRFADYLWHFYAEGSANLGTGISAMPSMHVTLAVWTVLAAHTLWKRLTIPAAVYALLIWCASIASGWHYALDGIVGAAIAIGSFRLCQAIAARNEQGQASAAPIPSPAA